MRRKNCAGVLCSSAHDHVKYKLETFKQITLFLNESARLTHEWADVFFVMWSCFYIFILGIRDIKTIGGKMLGVVQ